MRTRKSVIAVLATLLLLLVLASTIQAADAAKGKTLWGQLSCKSCHGDNGEGKFADPRAGDGMTADVWIKELRTPRANMPSFSVAQVSDADAADMNAYMQTLAKPASFTPATFPTQPSDPAGRILMGQKRCAACHGDGSGLVKARFTDQGRTVTTEAILKQLRTPAQRMPAYSATQVTDAEAQQLADFLKSVAQAPAATIPTSLPKAGPEGPPLATLALLGIASLGAWLVVLRMARAQKRTERRSGN